MLRPRRLVTPAALARGSPLPAATPTTPAVRRSRMVGFGLAILALALVLLVSAVVPLVMPSSRPDRVREAVTAAAALASALRGAEARLKAAASDPDLEALLDGVADPDDQVVGSRLLAGLAAQAGPALTDVCLVDADGHALAVDLPTTLGPGATVRDSRAPRTDGTGAAGAPCSDVAQVIPEQAPTPGRVSRALLRGEVAGVALAAPLRVARGVPIGLLTAVVRLDDLLAPIMGRTPAPVAALLADRTTGEVLAHAHTTDGPRAGGAADEGREAGDRGSLPEAPPASGPEAADPVPAGTHAPGEANDWATAAAVLPLGRDAPALELVTLWPATAPTAPVALLAALSLLGIGASLTGLGLARGRDVGRARRGHGAVRDGEASPRAAAEGVAGLHDPLTGFGGERGFRDELERQLDIHRRHGVPVALVLLELDEVEEAGLHQLDQDPDDRMRHLAEAVRTALRLGDRAFRIGGTELAIIMPHTAAQSAEVPASRLLRSCLWPAPGKARLSFSGGIAAVPSTARDRDELLRQAEAALRWSRRHGGAQVEVFDLRRHLAVAEASDLRAAGAAVDETIRRALLMPVFQPIVDLGNGSVLGFEGLVRPAPGSAFDGPAGLSAAAAASGRTTQLDLACLEAVAAAGHALGGGRYLSVNISPRVLESPDFSPVWLIERLERHGLEPSRVVVEVTEQEAIANAHAFMRSVGDLQQAGFRVAADDVGAGNAGLRLLSQVRFDVVKIDLSLVQPGTERTSSQAVLGSLCDLAARQGALIIAEGVETAEQLRTLRSMGVPAAQGYLLGRPGPDIGIAAVDLAALEAGARFLGRPALLAPRPPTGAPGLETTPA
jgi:diguanylate cyclase (GGDEF)-like protein